MRSVVIFGVLRFLSRRDLDDMSTVSKGFSAVMALACEKYLFRPLHRVLLRTLDSKFDVCVVEDGGHEYAFRSFGTLDDALTFLAPYYRRSYVDEFEVQLDRFEGNYCVLPAQWAALTSIFRTGEARHIWFHYVDLSALDDDAFVDAVRCRKLEVSWCDVRGGLVSDDVLRWCAGANGVLDLQICFNNIEGEHTVSDDALLEFCFPPDANSPSRTVQLDNLTMTSDTFIVKFFQRLLAEACKIGPSGFLVFTSKLEQRGLAGYARHLVQNQANPTYCFPERLNGAYAYHFVSATRVLPALGTSHTEFSFGYMDLRPTNDDRLDADDDVDDDEDDDEVEDALTDDE